jgi:carboxypeptidase C (cathepsin A)
MKLLGLIGFMTEQGPFKPNADNTLSLNEFAWNKVSNMVFIESPAGVGFSYSDDKSDYTTGDQQTAIDNYNLIQAFLTRFPEYASNDLYISSESYGGHYMPTLAKQIVDSNAAGTNPIINFKGFAVGNPYTDTYSGTPAMIDTYWGHQLIDKPTWDAYQATCKDAIRPNVEECERLAVSIMNGIGDLNSYALDYPVCNTNSAAKAGRSQRYFLLKSMLSADAGKMLDNTLKGSRSSVKSSGSSYEPCIDNYASTYLNTKSVQSALHVKSTKWDECSYTVKYNSTDSVFVSTAPIYNYLVDGGFNLNILVYSGDDDSVCGTIGTQEWIWDLGYKVSGRSWRTYTYDGQTAGYATVWENTGLGFLTIHGAGHEVPTYKPDVALDMWTRYLNGEFTKNQ